jgi:chitin disaccharide deacetylase
MVGGPAAADAIVRAHRLRGLRVGLHVALVDACPVLPPAEIRGLLRSDGEFDRNMVRAALRFFFSPQSRRQLEREIRAQFEAFRATGLRLDHVNAHKHMHLHPIVAALIVEIGREYGMKAMRLPSEPIETLRRAFPHEVYSVPLYRPWIRSLRHRLRRAGLFANDNIFGLAWSGGMVEDRLFRLIDHLPDGVTEIYLHPATERTPRLIATMPNYRHQEEFAALLNARLKSRIAELGIALVSYSDMVTARRGM